MTQIKRSLLETLILRSLLTLSMGCIGHAVCDYVEGKLERAEKAEAAGVSAYALYCKLKNRPQT